jgi:hypothetical protein
MMKRSSNGQAASDRQTGSGDELIDLMRYAGVPITRENYLELAYMGEPPGIDTVRSASGSSSC